ncbi:MAG: PKD domain-containing protein, partial [Chloroflexota bacterium]
MRQLILITIFIILIGQHLPTPSSVAQSHPSWNFHILEADETHLVIELTVPDFTVETRQQDGVLYQSLSLENWGQWGQVGLPQVPVYRVPVGMPYPGQPTITILETERETLTNYHLYPAPDFTLDDQSDNPTIVETFAYDTAAYAADKQYPGPLTSISDNGLLRNQPLFSLNLYPFQYNPAQQTLEVYRRMKVEVTFPTGARSRSVESATQSDQPFRAMIDSHIVNADSVSPYQPEVIAQAKARHPLPIDASYVIITHPDFTAAIQDLADYRADQGESVAVIETTELYGFFSGGVKNASAIKDFLTQAYQTWAIKPVYVLLVGDADADAVITDPDNNFIITGYDPDVANDFVPAYYESIPLFGPSPLDAWYERLTLIPDTEIPDPYPDIVVGRIPARTAADVENVTDKIINYEQSPHVGDWMRKALLVADNDTPFATDIDNIDALLPDSLDVTKMYDHNPDTSVDRELGPGALLVAYSGHGNQLGWGTWSNGEKIYEKSDITNLFNSNKYAFLTSVNCVNGYFADPTFRVFAEEFLLIADKGGVATWASTIFAFPTVNTPIQQALYSTLSEDEVYTLGSAASLARISAYTSNPHLSLHLFETFSYLGDPAVRLNVPAQFNVSGESSPATVVMGDEFRYDLTYEVTGQATTRDLRLQVTLPDRTIYRSATVSPSNIDGRNLTWELGDVSPGSYDISITAEVRTTGLDHNEIIAGDIVLSDGLDNRQELTLESTAQDQPIANLMASNDSPAEILKDTDLSASVGSGTNVSYSWDFGDGSANKNGADVDHRYDAVGVYTATVTASNGAGSQTKTTLVTIVDQPPQALFVSSAPDNVSQITTFDASASKGTNLIFSWDFGNGSQGSGETTSHDYTVEGLYTVTLTATNSSGSDVATAQVEIQEDKRVPVADFISSSPTELGTATTFNNNSDDGADIPANISYLWQFGDGNTSTTVNPTHTYAQIGDYEVQLTISNSLGNSTTTKTISIIDVPIDGLSFSQSSPTILGNSTSFNAATTAGSNITYSWDFGDNTTPQTGDNVSHTYAAVGTYIVTVTAANGTSSKSVTDTVTILDVPISGLTASNDGPHFIDDPLTTLTADVVNGSNVTYWWDFGDDSEIVSGKTVQHLYPAVGTFQAQVTASNGQGQQVQTTTVTIRDTLPFARFSTSSPDILGEVTRFQNLSSGTNLQVQWNFGDGHFTDIISPSHTYQDIGSYTVLLTITNSLAQHTTRGTVEITDVPITGLHASNDSPTPVGDTISFSATVTSGTNVTYVWDFLDGTAPISDTAVTHTFPIPGIYQVQVTASNPANTVTISDTVIITDAPISGLTANNDGPTALNEETTFSADIFAGTDVHYTWDFGDGSPLQTGQIVQHIYTDLGTYIAQVTAKNGVDTQVQTTTVTVVDQFPHADFDTSAPDLIGEETTFISTANGTNLTYSWDFGDGSPVLNGASDTVTHTYDVAGSYAVILTVSNSSGSHSVTKLIDIIEVVIAPVAGFTSSSPDRLGQTTTFINTSQDGGDNAENMTYEWNFGDGHRSQKETPTHIFDAIGTYTVTLTTTNRIDSNRFQDTVIVTDIPIGGLRMFIKTTPDGTATFSATVEAGSNVTYRWNLGDGSSEKQGQLITYIYEDSGIYEITLSAENSTSQVVHEEFILMQVLAPPSPLIFLPVIAR